MSDQKKVKDIKNTNPAAKRAKPMQKVLVTTRAVNGSLSSAQPARRPASPSPFGQNDDRGCSVGAASYQQSSDNEYETQPDIIVSRREVGGLRIDGRDTTTHLHEPIELPLSRSEIEDAEEKARKPMFDYLDMYSTWGYTAVIDAAYWEAKQVGHPFTKDKELSNQMLWREYGVQFLSSCPTYVFKSFLRDSIPARKRKVPDSRVVELYEPESDWVQRYDQAFAPCIYVRYLVDKKTGANITIGQAEDIITTMRQYVSGDENADKLSAAMDAMSGRSQNTEADIAEGYHYFLEGKAERAALVHTFCHALSQRLDELRESNQTSLPTHFKYVGYSPCAADRFDFYAKGDSTSWFSALMQAVCRHLFGDSFGFEEYVICYHTNHTECRLAEEVFSTIGQAYIQTGYGLGVAPGGLNVHSSDTGDMSAKVERMQWETTMRFRLQHFFDENLEEEASHIPAYADWCGKEAEKNRTEAAKKELAEIELRKAELRREIKELEEQFIDPAVLQATHDEVFGSLEAEKAGTPELSLIQTLKRESQRKIDFLFRGPKSAPGRRMKCSSRLE